MTTGLIADVERLLNGLEATQQELLTLFQRKLAVLTGAQAGEILRLAAAETSLANRLQQHQKERQRILHEAQREGFPSESLAQLVEAIGGGRRAALQHRTDLSRQRSAKLRQEGWVHWIVAHRAFKHHSELLDLIAHCGQKAPTYSRTTGVDAATRGAILDTSA